MEENRGTSSCGLEPCASSGIVLQRWARGQERDKLRRLLHTGGSQMACPRTSSWLFNLSVLQCYLL